MHFSTFTANSFAAVISFRLWDSRALQDQDQLPVPAHWAAGVHQALQGSEQLTAGGCLPPRGALGGGGASSCLAGPTPRGRVEEHSQEETGAPSRRGCPQR